MTNRLIRLVKSQREALLRATQPGHQSKASLFDEPGVRNIYRNIIIIILIIEIIISILKYI